MKRDDLLKVGLSMLYRADTLFLEALEIKAKQYKSIEAKQAAVSIWFKEVEEWRKDFWAK